MKNEYLYFVDFGLEHITLLVCKLTDNRLTEVPLLLTQKIEISSHRPQNVFSQIENFDYLVKLITKAEKQLNKDINEIIFLSKNDAFEIFFTTCKIEFKKAQKILQSHKEKLSTQVLKMFYEKTNYLCTILDLLCNNFILDDNIEIKNPYKMSCKKIILNSTIISIKNSFFKNFSVFLERYKIHMKHYISPCIATYNLMQYNLPKKWNFLFIDIGSCNTEYCIVMNRCVTFLDKVNLGGLDMTRDIATELKIYIRDADKVKQKIARTDIQNTKNTNTKFVVNQVEQIADARLNEIIQYIKKTIQEDKNFKDIFFKKIYVFGSSAQYKNTADIINEIFDTEVEVLDQNCILNSDILSNKIKEEDLKTENIQIFGAVDFYVNNLNNYKNAKRGFLFKIPSKISCFLKDILY